MSTLESLMHALNFDAGELEANRAGRMSPFQRERLRTNALGAIGCVGVATLIFGGLTVMMIASDDPEVKCFIVPFGAATALLVFAIVSQIYGMVFETKHETVKAVEGRAEREIQAGQTQNGQQRHPEYFWIINTDEGERRYYSVNLETYELIEDGARYRLYYSPKTLIPLSAEKLETP